MWKEWNVLFHYVGKSTQLYQVEKVAWVWAQVGKSPDTEKNFLSTRALGNLETLRSPVKVCKKKKIPSRNMLEGSTTLSGHEKEQTIQSLDLFATTESSFLTYSCFWGPLWMSQLSQPPCAGIHPFSLWRWKTKASNWEITSFGERAPENWCPCLRSFRGPLGPQHRTSPWFYFCQEGGYNATSAVPGLVWLLAVPQMFPNIRLISDLHWKVVLNLYGSYQPLVAERVTMAESEVSINGQWWVWGAVCAFRGSRWLVCKHLLSLTWTHVCSVFRVHPILTPYCLARGRYSTPQTTHSNRRERESRLVSVGGGTKPPPEKKVRIQEEWVFSKSLRSKSFLIHREKIIGGTSPF